MQVIRKKWKKVSRMNYKERLISEYTSLVDRIAKLEVVIYNDETTVISKEKLELMQKQFSIMNEYAEVLRLRLLKEME